MESAKYFLQKFLDTYLLPAVTSTFVALMYINCRWDRRNSNRKSFCIFNIFCFGDDPKHNLETTSILSEKDHAVIVLQPIVLPSTVLTHLRKQSLAKATLSRMYDRKKSEELTKLHDSFQITIEESAELKDPFSEMSKKSEGISSMVNVLKENEQNWDYYDIVNPWTPFGYSLKNTGNIFAQICDYNYKVCNEGSYEFPCSEPCLEDKDAKTENETIPEGFIQKKQLTNYYQFVYDIEMHDDNIHSGAHVLEDNMSLSEIEPNIVFLSDDNGKSLCKENINNDCIEYLCGNEVF